MDRLNELLAKGRRLVEEGEYKQALPLLREAETLCDDSVELCLLLGEALVEEGQSQGALQCLRKAQKKDAENIELLYALGDLLMEKGDGSEALECYQKIVDIDPAEEDAWVSQALVYVSLEQPQAAERACRSALKVSPESTFALNALGDVCDAQGQEAEALACYRKVLELDPEDAQAHLNLGEYYYDSGDLAHAEKHCQQAVGFDPGLTFACLTLGNICMDLDRNEDAINWFQQFLMLEIDPAAKSIRDEVAAVIEGLKS